MTDLVERTAVVPSADAIAVAETFTRLMRSWLKMRAQFLAAAKQNVEWSAQVILKCLATEGPMRAGTLAEVIEADPSTVSRQIAHLVREGLVERRADPADGRASVLVLTEQGRSVARDHVAVRDERFARMLSGWSERDLRAFARLLDKFTTDFEANRCVPSQAETPSSYPATDGTAE